ncbi:MAG TPA: ThuA domain-containing protein [Vicinamibacterales bacterium]|jgi:type 1 glutamine amidotransferase
MPHRLLAIAFVGVAIAATAASARLMPPAEASQPRFRALVFSKITNYYHDSIPAGVAAIRKLGAEHDFEVVASDDPAQFTDAQLAGFKVVVFNNTNSTPEKGALLDASQRAAFQKYMRAGGGFVGIHSASGTERDWEWYGQLVGAFFKVHPKIQKLEVQVEDRDHPSTRGLPKSWIRTEEPYDFVLNPRGRVHVLATYNPSSYEGHTMGPDHPIMWCHTFEGGRSWYTGMGHAPSAFSDEPLFIQHLLGGIEWAAGVAKGNCAAR